ncbi:hypothetical protein V8D89_012823 [Ganoderma adspersum]
MTSLLAEFPRRSPARMSYKTVRIMHPACSQLIFAFPAFPYPAVPGTETKPPVYGVDHYLVLDGCHIVTNFHDTETGDSYLSKDRTGRDRVLPRSDDVLSPGKYFYHPAPPAFPERIPDHWRRPMATPEEYADLQRKYKWGERDDMRDAVARSDGGCVVTKYQYMPVSPCHVYHLVPRVHESWFYRNSMTYYSWADTDTDVDDPANGITLRADLSECFELHGWVFYPAGEGRLMTYVCLPFVDYAELLHRRLVTLSRRVSDEFLYARFTHTMIKLVDPASKFKRFWLPGAARPSKEEVVLRTETHYDDDETHPVEYVWIYYAVGMSSVLVEPAGSDGRQRGGIEFVHCEL